MTGIAYKVDNAGERLTENVKACIENFNGLAYIASDYFSSIGGLKKGDLIHYSDDDIPVNSTYEVVLIITESYAEVRKI